MILCPVSSRQRRQRHLAAPLQRRREAFVKCGTSSTSAMLDLRRLAVLPSSITAQCQTRHKPSLSVVPLVNVDNVVLLWSNAEPLQRRRDALVKCGTSSTSAMLDLP